MAEQRSASAAQIALLAVVALVLVAYAAHQLRGGRREKFASERAREVHQKALTVFQGGGGDARYSVYKNRVPGADPVQYSDVRRLFREGRLTPDAVERVL